MDMEIGVDSSRHSFREAPGANTRWHPPGRAGREVTGEAGLSWHLPPSSWAAGAGLLVPCPRPAQPRPREGIGRCRAAGATWHRRWASPPRGRRAGGACLGTLPEPMGWHRAGAVQSTCSYGFYFGTFRGEGCGAQGTLGRSFSDKNEASCFPCE